VVKVKFTALGWDKRSEIESEKLVVEIQLAAGMILGIAYR